MTLQERLDEVLRLEAEATPGPWCVDNYVVNPGDSPGQWHVYETWDDDGPLLSTELGSESDARFIAAARNILRPLGDAYKAALSALEASHAERDKLRAELEAALRELANLRKFAEDFRNNAANAWMFEDDGLAKREEKCDGK